MQRNAGLTDDGDLIRRAQSGDGAAFTELVALRVDGLYAVAYRIVRDMSTAEDATQQALLDAWRKLPQLRDPTRFDGWLYRMVANAAKREVGRSRRWTAKLHLVGDRSATARDVAGDVADHEQLEEAFAGLSVDHRVVVVLRHYLGWTPAEIADELGVPAGTVSSRLHYALGAMRRALAASTDTVLPPAQEARR